MSNPKQRAVSRARSLIESEQSKIQRQLYRNRYEFRRLVEEQTTLKRELAVLGDLLRELDGKPITKQVRDGSGNKLGG